MQTLKQFIYGVLTALVFLGLIFLIPSSYWLPTAIVTITLLLTLQGFLVTRAMLYGFSHRTTKLIAKQVPTNSFSLIVPARDEASVIGHTIYSLGNLNYPKDLYEVMVIIRADDYETIQAAQAAIDKYHTENIRVIQIDGEAHNKAYSLNIGISFAKNKVIGIFDAEDEPHSSILQKINDYLMHNETVEVVQASVHLININSSWYASLSAVEYYFWFKSVLPFLATKKIIPLGGNTIFTKKEIFNTVGGYDESCLTEDADFGIKLAENNISIGVIEDDTIATTEEAPVNENDVIRQRSRWDQGYFQILEKSSWKNLKISQKFYAFYTLSQPLFRHLSFLNMIFAPLLASMGNIPVVVALFSFIPGYFLVLQLGLYILGLSDLARTHEIKVSLWRYITTILAFVPYQALLALATLRALSRLATNNFSWDKTSHSNSHRTSLAILE